MRSFTSIKAALLGGSFCAALCALPASGLAQISSINSANIDARVWNDVPSATLTTVNNYPSTVSFTEANVSGSGYANRDIWYFSNNGGASAYQFQAGDYFHASFNLTLTGGTTPAYDLEAGWLFSNPTGNFGGDCQSIVKNDGEVVQFGGPSYFGFSPANGGTSVPNYVMGQTYAMGFNYVYDPYTTENAFEYSVNGVYATSAPGDPYFDLGTGSVGHAGDQLGGYFQIQQNPTDPSYTAEAVFSNISIVPEPASLSLLAIGGVALLARRRAKSLV
ncbi:MAG: PEP-CTERM sorting domain-containing protein [Tepidisphaeraceae bacterium]